MTTEAIDSDRKHHLDVSHLSVAFFDTLLPFFLARGQGPVWACTYHAIDNGWSIAVRTSPQYDPHGTTHADVNIVDGVFYLLGIELRKEDRGKGIGSQFYSLFEEIARKLGCRRIEQTPSGWTATGETRADYLARYGWTIDGVVAFKDLRGSDD